MADISVLNTTAQLSGKTLVTEEGDWTIEGNWLFNRAPSAPFTVQAGSAKVTNLDADKLDGSDWASIAANLIPDATGTRDLGSSAVKWRDLFLSRDISIGGNVISNLLFTDNTYDIGASGATRPRDLFLARNAKVGGLAFLAATELTIAAGVITATQGYHKVDTEADAASDDLDTITAGTGVTEGFVLILRAENVARVVTVKDGTGNLLLDGDFALSATDRSITLYYDGTNWRELARSQRALAPANPVRVLDRDVSVATVVNTTAETSVYSFSVPGGTLSTNKALRVTVIGDYLNNSGVNRNLTVRVKFGATTILTHSLGAFVTSANRRALHGYATMSAAGATGAQAAYGYYFVADAVGVTGQSAGSTDGKYSAHTSIAEDSTVNKTFEITVQHDAASASLDVRIHTVQLELLD